MKVLTASEMREVDRLTIERGIPGLILMESAARGVVDFLGEHCFPLKAQHVTIVCGKGNNGGDGFAIARQLFVGRLCRKLSVVELFGPDELSGDAATNRQMLDACGCPVQHGLTEQVSPATVLLDAVLGTGLQGVAKGPALDAIRVMNECFPLARKIAVDIPSGLPSENIRSDTAGEFVRVCDTVTFTAPKQSQVLSSGYEKMGRLTVTPIGTAGELLAGNPLHKLNLTDKADLRFLFSPRPRDSNKGMYGHVMVVGGSFGKSGAPAMAGLAAYRTGAGLVTVAIPQSALTMVAAYRPELMTEPLGESGSAVLGFEESDAVLKLLQKMTVLALGPGLGTAEATVRLVNRLYEEVPIPAVVDADALNALAGRLPRTDHIRVLTPHPGEMGRLVGASTREVQADRLEAAQALAEKSNAAIVLKGDRTLIAFPDGQTWVNPTGSPAMATGGTGDILTGMIAGLIGQHPNDWKFATIAAVWLHGRCGELAASHLGEQVMLATDLLDYLTGSIDELRPTI